MSRKFTLNSVATFLGVLGVVSSAFATEPPVTTTVESTSIAVVVQTKTAEGVEKQLGDTVAATKDFVKTCCSEVDAAAKEVAFVSAERGRIASSRKGLLEKISDLRGLMLVPGCTVCVDGKSFSKEIVADVLVAQLDRFDSLDSELDEVEFRLKKANEVLVAAKAKAKRWQSVEKLIIGRVDRVLKADEVRSSTAAKEAAVKEAVELAEAIDAKISKAKSASKPESHMIAPESISMETKTETSNNAPAASSSSITDSSTTDSVGTEDPVAVTQAIQEFDAIFGK